MQNFQDIFETHKRSLISAFKIWMTVPLKGSIFFGAMKSEKFDWPAEVTTRGVLWKKVFLEISQVSKENTCARVYFLPLAQVFSWEFCEISKNSFFTEHLLATASGPEACYWSELFFNDFEQWKLDFRTMFEIFLTTSSSCRKFVLKFG